MSGLGPGRVKTPIADPEHVVEDAAATLADLGTKRSHPASALVIAKVAMIAGIAS